MTTKEEAIKQVYCWASSSVSESSEFNEDVFYPTPLFKSLSFKLNETKKGLIMVNGLQGSGKTRLLQELEKTFPEALYIKWTPNWRERLLTLDPVRKMYDRFLNSTFQIILEQENRAKHLITVSYRFEVARDYEVMEKKIGKIRCREIQKEALQTFLENVKMFLIDMVDYNRSNLSCMNTDIDELQVFWESLNKNEATLIIAVQKELLSRSPHFFWGKCDRQTLEPLSIEDLIKAFKLSTHNNTVFDNAALELLATLSRGIFRRFKKYAMLTIENNLDVQLPLSPENVNRAVTKKQLFDDLENELSDVFNAAEKRLQALKILECLRLNSNINIKKIAEEAGLTETMSQKIVHQLVLHRYLKIEHGAGKEKLVSLQL